MATNVAAAREELQEASAAAGGEIQHHINSIDEGLMELDEGDKTPDAEAHDDRVAEFEEKIANLAAEIDDRETVSHIKNSLDHLDATAGGFGKS